MSNGTSNEGNAANRRPRPIDIRELEPEGTGSAAPEAITEQPDLLFEREPVAKWVGTLGGLRLATMLITKRQRVARGEHVPPTPWLGIAVFCALAVAVIVVAMLLVRLLPG